MDPGIEWVVGCWRESDQADPAHGVSASELKLVQLCDQGSLTRSRRGRVQGVNVVQHDNGCLEPFALTTAQLFNFKF